MSISEPQILSRELHRPYTLELALLEAQVAPMVAEQFSSTTIPFRLLPHQVQSLQALLAWDRVGLFDEPRTGKTIVMALAAVYFARFGRKSIFLMPPVLFDQFSAEFASIGNSKTSLLALTGAPKTRTTLLEQIAEGSRSVDVLIMTKDVFKIDLIDILLAGYSVLFYDECHIGLQSCKMLTKRKARTTYASVQYFVEHAPNARLVLATGTPLSREATDVYPLISLKSPHAYESEHEFNSLHVTYKSIFVHGPRGRIERRVADPLNTMRIDLLKNNLYQQSVRALRLVVLDCRRPNVQEVPLHLAPAHLRLYTKLVKERMMEIDGELIDARSAAQLRVLAMQTIVNPAVAGGANIENRVIEAIETIMQSIRFPQAKILLFANYNATVEFLQTTFSRHNPAIIYGPAGTASNRAAAARFTSDPKCAMAIANPQSGGVGLTFGKVCQTVVMVEPVTTPGQFEQASSRVILAGQTDPVSVYLLRVHGTAAPKAIDIMLGRAKVNKEVTMDRKTMLDELLDKS